MTKYSGLNLIVDQKCELEKRAIFEGLGRWEGRHPALSLATAFTPVVGTAQMGADAVRDFSHGRIWGGLANTVGAVGSLVGLGIIGKGLGMLGKGGRAAAWIGRGAEEAGAVAGKFRPGAAGILDRAQYAGNAVGGFKTQLGGGMGAGVMSAVTGEPMDRAVEQGSLQRTLGKGVHGARPASNQTDNFSSEFG